MDKTHNEFLKEVEEASRQPTIRERTEQHFREEMNPELFETGKITNDAFSEDNALSEENIK